MSGPSAELVLFAGNRSGEAYLAFGRFKDDPIAIVPWTHDAAPGHAIARWQCPDWEDLHFRLKALREPSRKASCLRDAIPSAAYLQRSAAVQT